MEKHPPGKTPSVFSRDGISIYNSDSLSLYSQWPPPIVIVSDGPYGLNNFHGDLRSPEQLPQWYEPHVRLWTEMSTPQTTLWFWNSEIGWALVHPVLAKYGWKYVTAHVWDKGKLHVAGNANTKTLRRLPVVTELCVQYVREVKIGGRSLKDWVRLEWERSGIPVSKTNEVADVRNAATRKWFTKDHLWYFPPPEAMEKLASYANRHGKELGRPYFSLDGKNPVTAEEWSRMRAKFHCPFGVTNVWKAPPVNGMERLKVGARSLHLNQKPLGLMKLIIEASSDPHDTVWEPFGGLCTAAIASQILRRRCVSSEIESRFFNLAVERLKGTLDQSLGKQDEDYWQPPQSKTLLVPRGNTMHSGHESETYFRRSLPTSEAR
jgi:hypothetical protein